MRIFGADINPEDADLVIVPVCWSLNDDFTFEKFLNPVFNSSNEMELFHEFYGYQRGCKIAIDSDLASEAFDRSVSRAEQETNWRDEAQAASSAKLINEDYKKLTSFIEEKVEYWSAKGKLVFILGGDSSITYGGVKGFANLKKGFGILHFCDRPLLETYDGGVVKEENSLFNIGLQVPEVSKIVGIGYQTIAQKELSVQKENKEKIIWFSHRKNLNYKFAGEPFNKIAKRWVSNLPEFICLNLDMSVFSTVNSDELEYTLQLIVKSRKKIIGVNLTGLHLNNNLSENQKANIIYIVAKAFGRSRGKI